MLKRLFTAAVGVVGAGVVGLGVASATVWRADDVLVADASGAAPIVVTDPGVLELGGDPVTVTVSAPGDAHVVVAIGRDTDVTGWVGQDAHTLVTGLAQWHVLSTDDVAATGEQPSEPAPTDAAAPAPTDAAASAEAPATTAPAEAALPADPTGSDLWVAEASGDGSVELVWPTTPGRWSLVAVSTTGAAPTLSLAWPRTVTTPWLWPCVVVGGLMVLGALVVALRALRRRHAPEPAWTPVTTGSTPVVPAAATRPLTRREMREAAAHGVQVADRPRAAEVGPEPGRRARQQPAASTQAEPVPPVAAPAAPASDVASPPPWPIDDRSAAASRARLARRSRPDQPIGDEAGSPWPRSVAAGEPRQQDRGPAAPTAGALPGTAAAASSPGSPLGRPAAQGARPGDAAGAAAGPGSARPAPAGGVGSTGSAGPGQPAPVPSGSPAQGPAWPPSASRPAQPSSLPQPPAGLSAGPGQPQAAPHGRPSWAARPAVPPTAARSEQPAREPMRAPGPRRPAADAPPTPPGLGGRPEGWSPTLPPPGATVRPGAGVGPDDPHAPAGRPAWLGPGGRPDVTAAPSVAPGGPGSAEPGVSGSRADAWRRAWGLPQGETASDPQSDEQGEEPR
ncbi:hypothetical protein [Cellulomonas soli]